MAYILDLPGGRCNNNCYFCPSSLSSRKRSGTTDAVKAVMRSIPDKKSPVIIRGTEPLLREDSLELLRYAKQIGIEKPVLESNGRAFCYKDFCSKVISEGVMDFTISLFGPDAETHDGWSGIKGSFSQSVQGIRNLLELGARVKILFFLSARHGGSIGDYVRLIGELRPTSVAFLYLDLEGKSVRTVDKGFVQGLGREIRDLLVNLRGSGIRVEQDDYPECLDLSSFFEGLDEKNAAAPFPAGKEDNRKRIREGFSRRNVVVSGRPLKLYVELTRNCNFRCIMCPQPLTRGYEPSLDMPWPLFKSIADSLFPHADYVDLRGFGESVIMKDWRRCLDYALRFDCKYGLITNLSLKDDEMWELMVKRGFFIGVSLDGATKKTLEYIRRGANFGTIMGNLEKVARWRREYGMPEENIKLMVTVQKENLHELPDIIGLARKLGVKRVQFSPSRVTRETGVFDRDEIFDSPGAVNPILEKSLELAKRHGIELLMTGSFKQLETESAHGYAAQQSCDHPLTGIYVTAEGLVGPCNQLMLPLGILLGDLRKESFEEIWNGFNFRLFRKLMHTPHRLNHCDWCFRNRYGD